MSEQTGPRRWPLVLLGLLAVGIYIYFSIEIKPPPRDDRAPGTAADIAAIAARDDVNVLFVLIDTLRADRMSAYGYERETTPFLKSLAETGIRFDRHIAQSSWTKASMASMWSGLYPLHLGVTKFDHVVSQDALMPAELLSEAGFKTVGLYRNGWVNAYFGFDQGFERYYKPMGQWHPEEVRRLRPNELGHGSDQDVIDDAIEFLRIYGDTDRWFLYIHLMDLHEYTYDEETALFGNMISDLYDNSLLRTDWMVSQIHEYLKKRELLENTIVVILSDHGEAFGERGFEGHARSVFPETTETPLIISLPTRFAPGLVVDSATTNVDLWPTLLDLLGISGMDDVDGRSRMPEILAAAGADMDSPEGSEENEDRTPRLFAFLDENWGRPGTKLKPAISVTDGEFRYVKGSDIAGKPFEVLLRYSDGLATDQMEAHPEIAESLREDAEKHLEETSRFETEQLELDEMQLDQLRALGYELP